MLVRVSDAEAVQKFPREALNNHATFFFVSLLPPLVSDESPKCRAMVREQFPPIASILDV